MKVFEKDVVFVINDGFSQFLIVFSNTFVQYKYSSNKGTVIRFDKDVFAHFSGSPWAMLVAPALFYFGGQRKILKICELLLHEIFREIFNQLKSKWPFNLREELDKQNMYVARFSSKGLLPITNSRTVTKSNP